MTWRRHLRPARRASSSADRRSSGQSVVEFALIMPIMVFMLLGILDFARIFTSMLAVESAAREAADFGAWSSGSWSEENRADTLAGMKTRACIASRNLTGFEGSASDCSNPSISIDLIDEHGQSALRDDGSLSTDCDEAARKTGSIELGPCLVKVDVTYTFDVIVPIGIDLGGSRVGLPQDVTFTRSSIFAISDFTVESP